ncbi:hypothetical protein [Geodermatophilus sp. URMC 63]
MATYRATTALPYDNHERATLGLRGQLRLTAMANGAVPDWTTLSVNGPTKAPGLYGAVWFEWSATVKARLG